MVSWVGDRKRLALIAASVGMFTLLLLEELTQADEPITLRLVLGEMLDLGLLVGCSVSTAALALRMRAQEDEGRLLRRDLDLIRARNEPWRREMAAHLRELGAAIQAQFEAWRLTPAEQEVGLFLLKGFSHKEIARLRRTTEATIRQQAVAVYQKASLNGRAELSAFFLEELLLPGLPPTPSGNGPVTREDRRLPS